MARAIGADDAFGIGELQHGLQACDACQQNFVAFAGPERQQILGRGQRDIRRLESLAEDAARDVEIGPAAGAEIGVEGDAHAAPANVLQGREQARAARFADRSRA